MFSWISVALAGGGAAVGATARYLIMQLAQGLTKWRQHRSGYVPSRFPWATFIINVSGSFALGLLMGSNLNTTLKVVLGAGILGGFTTFSTMANEIVLLARDQHRGLAVWYCGLSVFCGIVAAIIGMQVG